MKNPINRKHFNHCLKKCCELCDNGNEEIAYDVLWSGAAYDKKEAQAAQQAKQIYAT